MTVVASYGMVLCGNSDDVHQRYRGRIEKVKFGVPINEAFSHDIPATLLVLLLKVNKEGPLKKDIWRAPGNQAQVRKLSHIMQHGRLVNIANFSVYTAASVIKKFLSKLPGGIFGIDNEQSLFNSILNNSDPDKQRQVFCRIFCALPVPSQHLLVLLFGTFRMVADGAAEFGTKMTPEAIGISVAPSLFHSCIHEGQKVKVEDVQRFKLASQVVSNIVKSFGHTNLFPRECYEFYARITGRTLRVDENWLFTFQYPSNAREASAAAALGLVAAKCAGAFPQPEVVVSEVEEEEAYVCGEEHRDSEECEDCADDEAESDEECGPGPSSQPNYPSTSGSSSRRRHISKGGKRESGERQSRSSQKEHRKLSNRLSSSVGEVLSASDCAVGGNGNGSTLLCEGCGETTRSLSILDTVHLMQTRRMHCRSEWFLSPVLQPRNGNGGGWVCRVRSAERPSTAGGEHSGTMFMSSPEPDTYRLGVDEYGGHDTGSSREPTPAKIHVLPSDHQMSSSRRIRCPNPTRTSRKHDQFVELLHFWNLEEKPVRGSPILESPQGERGPPLLERRPLQEQKRVVTRQDSSSSGQWPSPQPAAAYQVVSGNAVCRRRSWRTHYVRPNNRSVEAGGSLDVDERPVPSAAVEQLGHAHSLSGEGWPSSDCPPTLSDTPNRKRSLKKKTSTKF